MDRLVVLPGAFSLIDIFALGSHHPKESTEIWNRSLGRAVETCSPIGELLWTCLPAFAFRDESLNAHANLRTCELVLRPSALEMFMGLGAWGVHTISKGEGRERWQVVKSLNLGGTFLSVGLRVPT
jgi:hypothetical protein